jgi:hypothetical protein
MTSYLLLIKLRQLCCLTFVTYIFWRHCNIPYQFEPIIFHLFQLSILSNSWYACENEGFFFDSYVLLILQTSFQQIYWYWYSFIEMKECKEFIDIDTQSSSNKLLLSQNINWYTKEEIVWLQIDILSRNLKNNKLQTNLILLAWTFVGHYLKLQLWN